MNWIYLWLTGLVLAALWVSIRRQVRLPGLPSRSEEQLRLALRHVAYEFVAFERVLAAIVAHHPDPHLRIEVEAALLHARNLTDFFWAPISRRPPHTDGVYAAHYFPGWTAMIRALPPLPNQRYEAMSGQLAHVSIRRTQRDVINFDSELEGIGRALTTAWERWSRALVGSQWSEQLDVEVELWRAV